MAIVPISQTVTPITSIPDRADMGLVEFDAAATQFADQIKAMGGDLATWATQANALAVAINLALNLGIGDSDFLRFVRSPGDIIHTSAAAAPFGTLIADGDLISRTTYADLFKALVTDAGFTATAFTVTIADPAVFTKTTHGFKGGERLRLYTTGALPTGLNATDDYFVVYIDANTFKLSTSQYHDAIVATTGTQSGSHTYLRSLWGLGDGSTTFRKPNLLDVFERNSGTDRPVGTYQKGTLTTGDWDGTASTGVLSLSTTINKTGQDKVGADVPDIAAYPDLQYASITQTSYLAVATRPDVAGVTRPSNIALLPCVVY